MRIAWRIFGAVCFVGLFYWVWRYGPPAERRSVGDGILLGLLFAEVFLRRPPYPGIQLAGWTCAKCRGFNGTEQKPARTVCRACGAPR